MREREREQAARLSRSCIHTKGLDLKECHLNALLLLGIILSGLTPCWVTLADGGAGGS